MKVILDEKTIQSINVFQNLTGSSVIDCISEDDELYFVVAAGQYGLAVGKGGVKIKQAERMFKKPIKVFEFNENSEEFIKSVIHNIQQITINENEIVVKVKPSEKPKVIGKNGKNIKILNKILKRLFGIESLKVK